MSEVARDAAEAARLVERIREGDPSAEDELVRRYQRGVAIIIRRNTSDPQAVPDLCQETLRLALVKVRAGEVREPERLSGFIASLARFLALQHYRRHRREVPLEIVDGHDPPTPAPGPLDLVLAASRAALARQVLAELKTDRDREMLYRFYVLEEDKRSICERLGLSDLHFNRVLYRARNRFRELFEQIDQRKAG